MANPPHKKHPLNWKVPDGGWGWMIVLGTTIIMVNSSNLRLSYGVMFSTWYNEHDVSPTIIGIIFNVNAFLFNLMFPLIGPLTEEFGWRRVGMLSSFMISLATILCSFASSITHILFSYSILGGIFGGLSYAQLWIILPKFFDKHLGLANAFPMTAYPLCQFIFPILIPYLQNQYGFKGSMLLLGGIMLHSVAAAALFQPPEWHRVILQRVVSGVSILKQNNIGGSDLPQKCIGASGFIENNIEIKDPTENNLRVSGIIESNFQVSSLSENSIVVSVQKESKNGVSGQQENSTGVNRINELHSGDIVSSENSIEKDNEISNLIENNIGVIRLAENNIRDSYQTEKNSLDKESDQSNNLVSGERNLTRKVTAIVLCVLKSVVKNQTILKEPTAFILSFCFSIFISSTMNFNAFVPFIIINRGYSLEDAGLVLSYGAIANGLARFLSNWLSDFTWFKITYAYGCGTLLSLLSIVGFAFAHNFLLFSVLFVLQSFGNGMHMGLFNLVTKEIVGVDHHAASIGASGSILSIAFLILGSLVGYIKDAFGTYTAALIFIALLNAFSLFLWMLMPYAKSLGLKKKYTKN